MNFKIYLLLVIMILVKNELKKIKNTIDDEDTLNYLKYSHLEPIKENDVLKLDTSNKATQAPDIINKFSQTDKKDMMDKETDTFDELNKIDPPYFTTKTLEKFQSKEPSRAEKMAQVWTTTVEQKSPPTSHNESADDGEGFMLRNLDRGLRVAQLTGSAMLTAFNIADSIAQTTLNPVIGGAIDYFLANPSTEQNEEIPSSWPTAHRTPWAFVHILTFHLMLHTCWMLRNWSGVGGGGMITFLALAHMLDATQLVRGGWGGMITFLALAHMLDATQLVGDDNIPCACTHVGCYATGQGWVGGGG